MIYQLVDGESVQEVKATLEHADEMLMLEDFERWAREYVCQKEPDLIGVGQPPIYSWLQLAYLPNVRIVPTLQRLRNEVIRGRRYFGSFVDWLCVNKGFTSVVVTEIHARHAPIVADDLIRGLTRRSEINVGTSDHMDSGTPKPLVANAMSAESIGRHALVGTIGHMDHGKRTLATALAMMTRPQVNDPRKVVLMSGLGEAE